MKLALFVYDDSKWKRFSEYVEVDSNVADRFAALSVSGRLPRSHFNNHISFYPFGALQANQPMPESEWMDKIEDALGKVSRNVIGAAVLKGIRKDITIYPYLPADKNAFSDVHINPKQWTTEFRPGANVDEILLHELIHVVENNYSMYENRWGFMFDGSDFLTVNATNVYSCMLGRALRKDHHDFLSLPVEHFENPRLHYEQQAPNYMRADASAGDLVDVLRKIEGVWNPFSYFPAFANRGMFGYG
jgi:hypothetical protein